LLRSKRQRIHTDIAKALVERFADQIETAPAIIAHHYTEAGLCEPAARYWLEAAELALSRSANAEADRHGDAGLALVARLTDGPDRQSLELALQLAHGSALLPLKGFTAPETVAALNAGKRLLDAGVGTDLQRFSVLNGLCLANLVAAWMEPALILARQFVDVADRHDDQIYRLVGYRLLGTIQVFMGQNREALESLQEAERYRDSSREKLLSYRFGLDPGLAVLCYRIWSLTFLGLPNQAARVSEQVRAALPSHGHAHTVAFRKFFAVVWPEFWSGDFEACERHSAELGAYCTEKKAEYYRLVGAIYHASARAAREPTEENIAALRAAIDALHQSGARCGDSGFISRLAEALLVAGDVRTAETAMQESFAFVEQSSERFGLAELHRISGQIALKRGEPDRSSAEACFLQAMEIARSQEARLLELRAATDLARLWRDTGSPNDPRALLEPIFAAIEGGENIRDVRAARALLAEMG
jgi:tetratricopeptide (TPR) repeat protein